MAAVLKRLAGPVSIVGGVETPIFIATLKSRVDTIIIANLDTKSSHWSLSLVPVGGVAGNSNRLTKAVIIAARDTMYPTLHQVMEIGDFLSILTPTSSIFTVTASGVVGLT